MSYVIGIDASTSAVKAVAFDSMGNQAGLGRAELALDEPRTGWAEQDCRDWAAGMYQALRELGQQVDLGLVQALAITCQRETFVLLDDAYEPVRPAITWLDMRAGEQVRRFGGDVPEITGKPAGHSDALFKLIWLKENEPQSLAQTRTVYDTSGYLIHDLTGERTTSLATAATMTLVDIRTREYSEKLLGFAGLSRGQLPSLTDTMQVAGRICEQAAARTGLAAGTPVIATVGDGQAAGVGAGIVHGDLAYASLGTGVGIGAASGSYVRDPSYRTLEGYKPGTYYLEPVLADGTHLITWFIRKFGVAADDALGLRPEQKLEMAAARVRAGCDGLFCLPYFTGVLSPYWDHTARGTFFGLRTNHGLPEMYRAILEGISYEIRLCIDKLEQSRHAPVSEIVAMGGGAASVLWRQIIADVLNRSVRVCEQTEVTALGAAVHAAAAVGLHGSHEIEKAAASMTQVGPPLLPDEPTSARYDRYFGVYRDLYPACQALFGRIDSEFG